MKTIGIIGGMSWESTVTYYQAINRIVARELGGFHSAKILLHSVDFHEIEQMQRSGDWEATGLILADAGRALQHGGADLLILATNTMHKVADAITAATDLPFIHIADATGEAITAAGFQTVGLLGTRYTMEQDFYRKRLEDHHGLRVLVPAESERVVVNDVIFDELCHGRILDTSRDRYIAIIASLVERGAQAIILGCTEIGLLIEPQHSPVPVFDTTRIHAEAAALAALER